MKTWLGGLWLGIVITTVAGAAEQAFSRAVGPADFLAAGLAKLSPEELARLDTLVRDFKSGALERARREAAAAEARAAQAEQRAAVATAEAAKAAAVEKDKKSETGLLAKAKVLLMPGTEIEYATVESRLAGPFSGWEGRTVFTLENGQRWQVANGSAYSAPPVPSPAVKITPGALGSFWMTIEGVRTRVKVTLVSGGAK